MLACRTAVLIIGLFHPLVIQAQPFGDTEITIFDTEFLPIPPGPPAPLPPEPPLPAWILLVTPPEPFPEVLPAIFPLEPSL